MVEYSSDQSHLGSDGVKTIEEGRTIGQWGWNHSPYWIDSLRILRDEIRRFKANNERVGRAQERLVEINSVILQIFSDSQRQRQSKVRTNHRDIKNLCQSEENTNKVDGIISRKKPRKVSEHMDLGGEHLSTLGGRARTHVPFSRKSSSSATQRYHHTHHHH